MNKHLELIPEDGAIQALLKTVGYPKTVLGDGIGSTMNKLMNQYKNRFAIALVDDDKRKPKHFDLFTITKHEADSLQLLQKPESRHYLILIKPAIEDWLLHQANQCNVDAARYGFYNLKELKRVTKNAVSVTKNQPLQQFLHQFIPK